MGGSPVRFRVVSGVSAPDAGLPELEQGTRGHFHTSSTGRALPFAQDYRWTGSTVIFVIALLDQHAGPAAVAAVHPSAGQLTPSGLRIGSGRQADEVGLVLDNDN